MHAARASVPRPEATVSIVVMETVDNAIMLAVPGAMDAGLASPLFWGSLTVALAVSFAVTVPVNRALLARGKGHALLHAHRSRTPTAPCGRSAEDRGRPPRRSVDVLERAADVEPSGSPRIDDTP